jgi:hypothetical protein
MDVGKTWLWKSSSDLSGLFYVAPEKARIYSQQTPRS